MKKEGRNGMGGGQVWKKKEGAYNKEAGDILKLRVK